MPRVYVEDPDEVPSSTRTMYESGKAYFHARRLASTVPDNARSIPNPSAAPEGSEVVQGPKGGWYAVPAGSVTDQQRANPDKVPNATGDLEEIMAALAGQIEEDFAKDVPGIQAKLDKWVGTLPLDPNARVGARIDGEGRELVANLVGHLGEIVLVDGEPVIVYDFPEDGGVEVFFLNGDDWYWPDEELADYEWHEPGPAMTLPEASDPMDMVAELQAITEARDIAESLNSWESSGTEIPESLDIRSASEINGLSDYGINGGINTGATTIAVMPDGSRVFIKDYRDVVLGDGAASMAASKMLDEMGVNAPLTMYDNSSKLHLAAGVENARPMRDVDRMSEEFYWRDVTQAIVGGVITGNGDLHLDNMVMDRRGRVWVIDSDLAGNDIFREEELTGDAKIKPGWTREIASRIRQHGGAGDAEIINEMALKMVNRIDDDVLDEMWENARPDSPEERIAENIMRVRAGNPLIPEDRVEDFNDDIMSVEEWHDERAWMEDDY